MRPLSDSLSLFRRNVKAVLTNKFLSPRIFMFLPPQVRQDVRGYILFLGRINEYQEGLAISYALHIENFGQDAELEKRRKRDNEILQTMHEKMRADQKFLEASGVPWPLLKSLEYLLAV